MIDMNKAIKGLEHCLKDGCKGCPYNYACSEDDFTLTSITMIKDVLEMLKEQEPKSAIIEGFDVAHVGRCPSCHVILTPFRANYCYCCGQAVKWG